MCACVCSRFDIFAVPNHRVSCSFFLVRPPTKQQQQQHGHHQVEKNGSRWVGQFHFFTPQVQPVIKLVLSPSSRSSPFDTSGAPPPKKQYGLVMPKSKCVVSIRQNNACTRRANCMSLSSVSRDSMIWRPRRRMLFILTKRVTPRATPRAWTACVKRRQQRFLRIAWRRSAIVVNPRRGRGLPTTLKDRAPRRSWGWPARDQADTLHRALVPNVQKVHWLWGRKAAGKVAGCLRTYEWGLWTDITAKASTTTRRCVTLICDPSTILPRLWEWWIVSIRALSF